MNHKNENEIMCSEDFIVDVHFFASDTRHKWRISQCLQSRLAVESITPIDECNIVHGPAPRVVQLNSDGELRGTDNRRQSVSRQHTCGSQHFALHQRRRARDNVGAASLATVQRWTSILLNVIGLKSVGCLQRRRQMSGSTPLTLKKQSQLNFDVDSDVIVGSHPDCRFHC
jgi:hypothetical protein